MFGGRSFDSGAQRHDSAEDLVDGWLARAEERAARSHRLAARLGELTATARSEGGRVAVTVGPAGTVTDLQLDEAVRDRPAVETAREILATLRAAQASLAALANTVAEETMAAEGARRP